MSEHAPNSEFVQSLERGLAVIKAFGPDRPQMTISEVAVATGTTRATARRFLLTLEHLGHIRSDGRKFSLTPHVLGLGYAYLSSLNWWKIAQVAMEDVVRELQESCSASVLDGKDVIYVARVSATRIMSINLSIRHAPARPCDLAWAGSLVSPAARDVGCLPGGNRTPEIH